MVKKRGKKAPSGRAEQQPPAQQSNNPFEQIFQHKKFDVLGKRSKGQSRKLVKSRTDAVDKVGHTTCIQSLANLVVRGSAPSDFRHVCSLHLFWGLQYWSVCSKFPVLSYLVNPHCSLLLPRKANVLICRETRVSWWSTSTCASPMPFWTAALEVTPSGCYKLASIEACTTDCWYL